MDRYIGPIGPDLAFRRALSDPSVACAREPRRAAAVVLIGARYIGQTQPEP
jgi:hypothetical protein